MDQVSSVRCHGGWQKRFSHMSASLQCKMTFSVFVPPAADNGTDVPVLYWLSGLTCSDENFSAKAGAQRRAAELGMMLVIPDTSPRGEGVPDDADGAYDFGLAAGFYVNATQSPWSKHYHMYDYIVSELPALIRQHFSASNLCSISGHSMGGHGALMIALRNPDRYRSVSAFAPIVNPIAAPWGQKAFAGYLGEDQSAWQQYDTCVLLTQGAGKTAPPILVDQGLADTFLDAQLMTHRFVEACDSAEVSAQINLREHYDHSYYFINTFIDEHLDFHGRALGLIESP